MFLAGSCEIRQVKFLCSKQTGLERFYPWLKRTNDFIMKLPKKSDENCGCLWFQTDPICDVDRTPMLTLDSNLWERRANKILGKDFAVRRISDRDRETRWSLYTHPHRHLCTFLAMGAKTPSQACEPWTLGVSIQSPQTCRQSGGSGSSSSVSMSSRCQIQPGSEKYLNMSTTFPDSSESWASHNEEWMLMIEIVSHDHR